MYKLTSVNRDETSIPTMPKFWMSIPVLSGDGELLNYMTLTVGPVSATGRNAPLIQFFDFEAAWRKRHTTV